MTQSIIYDAGSRAIEANDGLLARLGKIWADYRLYRATLEELRHLSDRELADLGIHRSAIADIARQSVYSA